jgi:hypothetical protein
LKTLLWVSDGFKSGLNQMFSTLMFWQIFSNFLDTFWQLFGWATVLATFQKLVEFIPKFWSPCTNMTLVGEQYLKAENRDIVWAEFSTK